MGYDDGWPPVLPGKHQEDGELGDPAGKTLRVAWCPGERLSVTASGIELDSASIWCNVMGPLFGTVHAVFLPLLIWVGGGV
jgi:hypothetical protein